MSDKFWLIQRGTIRKDGGPSLTGKEGVVNLDYMGSAEFEFGAIPFAFRKMMNDFEQYGLFDSGIHVPGNNCLMVFCKKDYRIKILVAIREFIENPYHLKEWSDLEKVVKVADFRVPWSICHTQFWWCIDKHECGQWMAFLGKDASKIYSALKYDYENWWLEIPKEKRDSLYQEAINCRY